MAYWKVRKTRKGGETTALRREPEADVREQEWKRNADHER
jgi:hypothetical protein